MAVKLSFLETLSRIAHLVAGIGAWGVALWFLFAVSPFNPYGFWGFLIAGLVLILLGRFGKHKDVFLNILSLWF